MKAEVQTFLQTLNDRQHIYPLIRQAQLNIKLIHKNEQIIFIIHDGNIQLEREEDPSLKTIAIIGEIPMLLSGEGTLRGLISQGLLQINASFRTILLLEALFYLGKPFPQQQKII